MKNLILQPTVVRPRGSYWCLMNRQERGWSSSCYTYPTLAQLQERWDVVLGEAGQDEHGPFIVVRPAQVAAALAEASRG